MAVQKSKKSKSKKKIRQSNSCKKKKYCLFKNNNSNEINLYHNISSNGYYRGKRILQDNFLNKVSNIKKVYINKNIFF